MAGCVERRKHRFGHDAIPHELGRLGGDDVTRQQSEPVLISADLPGGQRFVVEHRLDTVAAWLSETNPPLSRFLEAITDRRRHNRAHAFLRLRQAGQAGLQFHEESFVDGWVRLLCLGQRLATRF